MLPNSYGMVGNYVVGWSNIAGLLRKVVDAMKAPG